MSANAPSPNPLEVAWRVWRAMRVRRPGPTGSAEVSHAGLQPVLDAVAHHGVPGIAEVRPELTAYRTLLAGIDPDTLTRDGALAFWMNLYNAEALAMMLTAHERGAVSVLDLVGGFDDKVIEVAGETLSLTEIEHGKVRRFGDPRVHLAIVCGSLSCPTLHPKPFDGGRVDEQLDRQARHFMAAGGARADRASGTLSLSRVLLWYGGDFARPGRMPSWLPVPKARLLRSVQRWLPGEVASWAAETKPRIRFQPYDWALGCSIS